MQEFIKTDLNDEVIRLSRFSFGVNNLTWEPYRSIFGLPFYNIIPSLLLNYRMMRIRAFIGFIPLNDAIQLFPGYARRNGYHSIE